jgi:hypothetical protein
MLILISLFASTPVKAAQVNPPRPFQLRLPRRHLIGVNVELLRDLGNRPLILDRCNRNLCLEGRRMAPRSSFLVRQAVDVTSGIPARKFWRQILLSTPQPSRLSCKDNFVWITTPPD